MKNETCDCAIPMRYIGDPKCLKCGKVLTPTKEENVFKVGDRVFFPKKEFGFIQSVSEDFISVKYKNNDGIHLAPELWFLLSFTSYEVNANQIRPFEPKNGDVIVQKYNGYISIFKSMDDTNIESYVLMDGDNPLIYNDRYYRYVEIALATESQKQLLFDRLEEDGKKWNTETRQLESIEKPFEDGDVLYTNVDGNDFISIAKNNKKEYLWMNVEHDNIYYRKAFIDECAILATKEQKQCLFDRLERDGKRWNPETRQLEDLNEPKVGDLCILWSKGNSDFAIISVLSSIRKDIVTSYYPKGLIYNGRYGNAIKWDGTKRQFDKIRNGGENV